MEGVCTGLWQEREASWFASQPRRFVFLDFLIIVYNFIILLCSFLCFFFIPG